ncbi:hypothetical protein BKA70DRAFT_1280432 [Coprinopsis sp. MPI-PUGE-AT-0042]|nr:hypothetical protein BKA70DRAFT_1280432 [Coprinopsis sp. MPI-PUGE-AT-0042]
MSTSTERDAQLLAIGQQCSHPQCTLIDFLPFKCQHCHDSFCQEHYKYDASKHNRVAPECPLCNTPIGVKPGQDPNIRMDQHLDNECSVVTGRVQAKKTPICAAEQLQEGACSHPSAATSVAKQFCPSHRFPSDHTCKAPAAPQGPARPTLSASASSTAKNLNTKASSKASEAVSSMKQSVAAAKASTSTAAASASKSMPFNKTDRRAKAERASRLKAMEAREKKGVSVIAQVLTDVN